MRAKMNLILLFVFLLLTNSTFSLPRFAIKENLACIDCHVNPTGGIIRNSSGWSYSKNMMAMVSPRSDFEMSNRIGKNIQFGFDARGQYLLQMTDSTTRTDFQRMSASLYGNIDLSEDISFVARYDFIQDIWEGYAIAHLLPEVLYIKGGSFSPNYGIKIDDHTAYTRGGDFGLLFTSGEKQGLIYNPFYVESGIEVGFNLFEQAFLTASVGNSGVPLFVKDPSFTANLKISPQISEDIFILAGGSLGIHRDQRSSGPPLFQQISPQVKIYGGYFGLGFEKFSLLGEYDIATDYRKLDSKSSFLMLETSYTIFKGLDFVLRWDRFDANTKNDDDELNRFIIGFEFFPYSFVEIRPQFRIQSEKPSVMNNSAVVQFHIFY